MLPEALQVIAIVLAALALSSVFFAISAGPGPPRD